MTARKASWFAGAIVALAALAAISGPAPLAIAHDNLQDASPAADETVTQLDEVVLTFSGELVDFSQASFAQVQGPDGLFYESTCSTIDRNILSTPVELGEPGIYSVVWNAVSSDGHPISEGYEFTYAPSANSNPGLGWDLPACGNEDNRSQPGASTPEPTTKTGVTASPEASPSVLPAPPDESAGIVIPIIVGAAIVGVGIVSVALLVSQSRKRNARDRA